MRFSTKLVLFIAGLVVASGAIQASLYGKSSTRSLQVQIVDRLGDRAFHTMDMLDRYFYERYLDARALASAPQLASGESSPRQIAAMLEEYLRWHREYLSAAFYGMDRSLIADTARERVGERADLESAWGEIAAGRDFAIVASRPAETREPALLLAFVVRDGRGAARGLFVSRQSLQVLDRLVGGASGPHATEEPLRLDLLDRTGRTLSSNDDEHPVLRVSADWSFIEPRIRAGETFGNLKFVNPAEGGVEELLFFIRERGFRDYPGNDWTLSVEVSTATAFAPAAALRNRMTALLLIAGTVLLAVVFFAARAFTRPIADLRRTAEEIGRGNLGARVGVTAANELGLFAETFNRMAANVQESQLELAAAGRNLEGLVEKRTAELQRANERLHTELAERIRAQEALAVRERLLRLNTDIGEALSLGQTLEATLQLCTDFLVRDLDAAFVRIWTLGEEAGVLELQASAGRYTRLDGRHSRKRFGELMIGIIAETQRPVLTNEVIGDPAIADQEWARREGMTAFAGHPLVVDGRTVGVMALFSCRPLEPFALTALGTVADKIAAVVGRRMTEESLRASERHYRELFESSRDGIYVTDADGVFTSMNPAGARILGHATPAGIVGRPSLEYWRDESEREAFREKLRREKSVSAYPIHAKKNDGTFVELEASSRILEDGAGVFLGIEGVLRDVTQRVKADAERDVLVAELQEAAANIRTLSGLLPICAGCKKIRDEQGRWNQIETYVSARTEAEFSHGLCPDCSKLYFPGASGRDPGGKA